MRILALQLKRIGDLILTTPALRMMRAAWPDAHITLGVNEGCASLLPAISFVDTAAVFGRGRGFAPWQQVLTGPWDLCVDFSGTDRAAFASLLSRAKTRAAFTWVRKKKWRALAHTRFIESSVRDRHTIDHYLDLVTPFLPPQFANEASTFPELELPASALKSATTFLESAGLADRFALLHPGTARPEKYWLAERWAEVARTLQTQYQLPVVITSGPHEFERAHAAKIQSAISNQQSAILLPPDLLTLAALVQKARLVISCDTAVVHLAGAFRTPQIALFGPTNPFHWRPRHDRAIVLSAAHPQSPLTDFTPRMHGAPMDAISTQLVLDAIRHLSPQL